MLSLDELRQLWIFLAAFCLCDIPVDVKDFCRRIMKYIEKVGKDL